VVNAGMTPAEAKSSSPGTCCSPVSMGGRGFRGFWCGNGGRSKSSGSACCWSPVPSAPGDSRCLKGVK
jgi:hypothetical protein